jgi:acyl-CoA thioesterase FadM
MLLDVPDEVLVERVAGRRVDPVSGRVYHVKHRPAQDPVVQKRLIQRSDDTREKILRRLVEFHESASSICDFYREMLITIRIREVPDGVSRHSLEQKSSTVALDENQNVFPEQVFDALRRHLEGDAYWGTSFTTHLSIKGYECGTSMNDILSVSSYFTHMQWRMVNNGCLRDAQRSTTVAVRAQTLQLDRPLVVNSSVVARCSVIHVGRTSVELSFLLSDVDGLEYGSGKVVLVFLQQQLAAEVPGRDQLLQLIPGAKETTKERVHRWDQTFRHSTIEVVFSKEVLFTPGDMDNTGGLNVTSCMRRALDAAYGAVVSGAIDRVSVASFCVRKVSIDFLERLSPGTRVAFSVGIMPREGMTEDTTRRLDIDICRLAPHESCDRRSWTSNSFARVVGRSVVHIDCAIGARL